MVGGGRESRAGDTISLIKAQRWADEAVRIKEPGIFGSYARGEQKRGSDIDILVEFDELPGIFQFIIRKTISGNF